MRVIVKFLGPIGGGREEEFQVEDLEQLKKLLNRDPELREWLKVSAVAVNDQFITTPNYRFREGDRVLILPPVCGG
ncbi:MAG: MoaD/ThiS family protein [Campylobacterales bacterium]